MPKFYIEAVNSVTKKYEVEADSESHAEDLFYSSNDVESDFGPGETVNSVFEIDRICEPDYRVENAIRSVSIKGIEYWDRRHGNTYYSVVVEVNGQQVIATASTSGYDQAYIYAACEKMIEGGYIELDDDIRSMHGTYTLRTWGERERVDIYYSKETVTRFKDLFTDDEAVFITNEERLESFKK